MNILRVRVCCKVLVELSDKTDHSPDSICCIRVLPHTNGGVAHGPHESTIPKVCLAYLWQKIGDTEGSGMRYSMTRGYRAL